MLGFLVSSFDKPKIDDLKYLVRKFLARNGCISPIFLAFLALVNFSFSDSANAEPWFYGSGNSCLGYTYGATPDEVFDLYAAKVKQCYPHSWFIKEGSCIDRAVTTARPYGGASDCYYTGYEDFGYKIQVSPHADQPISKICGPNYGQYGNPSWPYYDAGLRDCTCPSDMIRARDGLCRSTCDAGTTKQFGRCYVTPPKDQGQCAAGRVMLGNPCNVGNGNKFQREAVISPTVNGMLGFELSYNSYNYLGDLGYMWSGALGRQWLHRYEAQVELQHGGTIGVKRPDGREYEFSAPPSGTFYLKDADIADTLQRQADTNNVTIGWTYTAADSLDIEQYSESGKLLNVTDRQGRAIQLTYAAASGVYPSAAPTCTGVTGAGAVSAGLLACLTDSYGRQLNFSYDAKNRINKLADPAGNIFQFAYEEVSSYCPTQDCNNLTSITYPDGKKRVYFYNEVANTFAANLPNALTGITDENGMRFATYKYDTSGRAISTEHAGGAEKVSIAYTTDINGNVTSSSVTDALNTSRTYSFTNILGVVKSTGVSQPCASCGGAAANAMTYDTNGNVASRTDFNGNQTTYVYDLARNLETSRTEGLTSTGVNTPQTRTISTTWHATYRLPLSVAEPGKTTTFTYDSNGNVLTKTITDTALSTSRTWTYTYNSLGQVLTANGPRTDMNDTTTYTYYTSASSTAGSVHSIGDLATVTNALGHVTSITNYDLNGRPLSITDANGIVTTLTYWPRGWLKTRTVNGLQTTSYDYDGVGQLIKVTLPDGSYLSYSYDAAHRLTDIADGSASGGLSGNKIHYTLDAMGNRTQEDTKDPNNNIVKTRSRIFDPLNRLQKEIGGTSPSTQITQYGYDNNGNTTTVTDPLNLVTTNGYDALNRLIQITDPNTPTAGVTQNTYNARDQLTQVKDPRLVTTNYTVDGLGNVSVTQSPDSGTTNIVYDAAGNLTQKTDARGVVSNYTYDALNRLTGISYPVSPSENTTFVYDYDGFYDYHVGRLSYSGDADGYVIQTYDAYGNIESKGDWLSTAGTSSVYVYDSANRVVQITYPSGRVVIYTRNALGQITQVSLQESAGAPLQALIDNVAYEPFGPIKSISYHNGVTTTLQHDADYRVSRITTTSTPNWDFIYSYDVASQITGQADQIGTGTSNNSKLYEYDNLHRLIVDDRPATLLALDKYQYQYDVGGNRTQLKKGVGTAFIYPTTFDSSSNRATQYVSSAIAEDAAGNISSVGSKTFSYNNANRLAQTVNGSTTVNYRYNAFGQRTTKLVTVGTTTTTTHYDYNIEGKYLTELQLNANATPAQGYEYIWLDDLPIAQLFTVYGTGSSVVSTQLTYIHTDHLNTPKIMTDSSKKIVWRWDNEAYGRVMPNNDPDGDTVLNKLDLRYAGQIADSEAGLFYNMNRYYDQMMGRYTQSDPIGLDGGLNTYSYVKNNPLLYTDPTGLQVAQGIELGAYIGTAIEPGGGTAVGAIAGGIVGTGVLVYESCKDKSCPPCTPYAKGTIGYLGPHTDHDHFPIGRPHLNLFVVNQNPKTCSCFWNKAEPDAAAPPVQPGWVNLNGGFPPLSP